MQELIFALSNPGTMSSAQWLVLAIGLFIVLGSLYFILKLYKLIRGLGKTTYTPNIGLSRHPYKGQSVSKNGSEGNTDDASSETNAETNNNATAVDDTSKAE